MLNAATSVAGVVGLLIGMVIQSNLQSLGGAAPVGRPVSDDIKCPPQVMPVNDCPKLVCPQQMPLAQRPSERDPCNHFARLPMRKDLHEHIKRCAVKKGITFNRIAEVGVWKGDHAKMMWDAYQPKTMALVDMWAETTDPRYKAENENIVRSKFPDQIEQNTVTTVRGDSNKWFDAQLNNSLDLIYLDTIHAYGQTAAEINRIHRIISPQGYICVHDFGHPANSAAGGMEYGVIEALVDFAIYHNWELLGVSLNDEPYRSMCMQRVAAAAT